MKINTTVTAKISTSIFGEKYGGFQFSTSNHVVLVAPSDVVECFLVMRADFTLLLSYT